MENPTTPNVKGNYKGPVESDPTKFHIEKKPSAILGSIFEFFKGIFSIKDDLVSYGEVVKETKEGVGMTGYNVWILMCSIAIASVGLNVNSTAVIVGAMLISPLMGPIRGVGVGIGINDFSLLVRSIKNLGITVGISLSISFLYFLVSPIDTLTEQLFIRTEPNFLDVVVAFVGGLAGVIAVVKGKKDTVIPGVAIATALMPPLCTAGYGLAVGNLNFFFGASYLFLINSVLIALSTLLIIRYFNFPKRKYVDPAIEKKVKTYIILFMLIVVAPSGYLFYKMTKKNIFESSATNFVSQVVEPNTSGIVTKSIDFKADSSVINLIIQGDNIDEKTKTIWRNQLGNYGLKKTELNIIQSGDYKSFVEERLKNAFDNSNNNNKELVTLMMNKDSELNEMSTKIREINQKNAEITKSLKTIIQDLKIDYPECLTVSVNHQYSVLEGKLDTAYTMLLTVNPKLSTKKRKALKLKIEQKILMKLKDRNILRQDSIPVYIF